MPAARRSPGSTSSAAASWAGPVQAADAEAAYLCRSDALRLCMSEIPDRERITACMKANRAKLSPGCRTVFNKPSRPGTIETASRVR